MNDEQAKSGLRSLLIGIAGLIGGWFAHKGYITTEQITAIVSSPVFVTVATMIAGAVWGLINHTQANAVAVVDKIAKDPASPVKAVITTNTQAGRDLASDLPGLTTVVAGTQDAKAAATGATS